MAAKARHTLTVSFPAGRIQPQGKNYKEATTRPASASSPVSGSGPHAPAHLSIRSGWLGGGTRGVGVGGWKEKEGRAKEGAHQGLRPPEARRRRSGRYRRQGAATWRSERRRRGFTTTVAPVAAAATASVASATAGASAPSSAVTGCSRQGAFRIGGSISAGGGPGRTDREGESEEAAAQLLGGHCRSPGSG